VIVLDALDECGDSTALEELVSLLAELNNLPTHFKIFFTCRPHHAVIRRFRGMARTFIEDLDKQPLDSISSDIHLYVNTEISLLMGDEEDELWPPEPHLVTKLVGRCGGLFEIAALRMRRIRHGSGIGNSYHYTFNMILQETDGTSTFLEPELFSEYRRFLRATYSHRSHRSNDLANALSNFRRVVGTLVTLLHPLSLKSLAALIGMTVLEIQAVLRPLSALIRFSTDAELVYPYHASFRDFLLASQVSTRDLQERTSDTEPFDDYQLVIDSSVAHHALTTSCFRIMERSLRFNICGIKSSFQRNLDIKGIAERVDESLPSELVYATHYWADHLQLAPDDYELLLRLKRLMDAKFLFWLEVLSLEGQTLLASSALLKSLPWVRVSILPA
jgi:hypothetical protein